MPFESRKFEQPKKPEESEAEKSEPEKIEGETTAKFSAEEIVELFAERNKEKPLNPEEIEQLGGEMNEYVEGLKARIEEIKAELEKKINEKKKAKLEAELEELQTEYEGLSDMANAIEVGDYEEITVTPIKIPFKSEDKKQEK